MDKATTKTEVSLRLPVRQHWLWVAHPEYALGEDVDVGDPSTWNDDWWTCHIDAKKGDLALLYFRSPWKRVKYLMRVHSDAYVLEDKLASEMGWKYGCEYRPLYKFVHPVTCEELKAHPQLSDWGAISGNFQRAAWRMPDQFWTRFVKLAGLRNHDFPEFVEKLNDGYVPPEILLEEELEERLVSNLGLLRPFGFDLKLYTDSATSKSGRQLICHGNGARIDLLCFDTSKQEYVVIELKNERAGQNTFGQIWHYIAWVKENIAGRKKVSGLVISRGSDVRFDTSLRAAKNISRLDLQQLGFK